MWVNGVVLRSLIFAKNKTQLEVAERAGITGSYLSKIIHERVKPPQRTINRIARVLRVEAGIFTNMIVSANKGGSSVPSK